MLTQLKNLSLDLLKDQTFDYLSWAIIDFKKYQFEYFETHPDTIFDLASLTKPLTLSLHYFKYPEVFKKFPELMLLLNHEAGIVSGGRLSHSSWQQELLNLEIKKSETLYSDYSAIRLMLELEQKLQINFEKNCIEFFEDRVKFWKNLTKDEINRCAPTGFNDNKIIKGEVHDPNAYIINEFTSHAGLFASVANLSKIIIKFDKEFSLIDKMSDEIEKEPKKRFILGWDRAQDLENTLAGKGCSNKTFGHLGFTGTSIWIDCEKKLGHVILSNATQNYWYDRTNLTKMRKTIGNYVWNIKG